MRYAWTFREEYFGRNPLKGLALAPLLAALRVWDRRTAAEVDRFVAISRHVAERIRRFYGRECDVVYPPVDVARCTPAPDGRGGDCGFDLVVSALVPYKRIDLAVETYTRHGWPLKVVGVGGAAKSLSAKAGPSVEFLGWRSDEDVLALYRRCRLLIFPGEEDFGIVPLEAQACGRPVVAFGRGGALETVLDGRTGVFFAEQSMASLADAVERAARQGWDSAAIRAHAETFGPARFIAGLAESLARLAAP
jgi:glycosyltransferase involved in cell wall biosynthesis